MTKCDDCGKEMTNQNTKRCIANPKIKYRGQTYERNTSYYDVNKRCHDCGIENKKGNLHHFGCDIERCPICERQLISCAHGEVVSDALNNWSLMHYKNKT